MEGTMDNKKKAMTIATASAAAIITRAIARARRRSRIESSEARKVYVETSMPMLSSEKESQMPSQLVDEAHAPGHKHLRWSKEAAEEDRPVMTRHRPFSKHQRGMRHPGRQ